MEIRPATRDDVAAIVTLLAEDQLGRHREDPGPPLPSSYLEMFEVIDADDHNVLVVGVDDGEVVATLQLTFLPYLAFGGAWRALVEAVRVASTRRGQGLGEQLMAWAEDAARDRGCHLVQLTSNLDRVDAHRFYERIGYERSHAGFKKYLTGDVHGTG